MLIINWSPVGCLQRTFSAFKYFFQLFFFFLTSLLSKHLLCWPDKNTDSCWPSLTEFWYLQGSCLWKIHSGWLWFYGFLNYHSSCSVWPNIWKLHVAFMLAHLGCCFLLNLLNWLNTHSFCSLFIISCCKAPPYFFF